MAGPVITLLTDFGRESPYVAVMKGVVLSINPGAALIDLTHGVPPQDVAAGAWAWAEASRWFPAGSIHVGVVDPGVGSEREIVCATIDGRHYLGPDNGLFGRLAARCPPSTIFALTRPEFWLHPVSATFHGRDMMAPAAARLSLGLEPAALGEPRQSLVRLPWPEVHRMPGKLTGEVTAVDSFGNLVTNIRAEQLAEAPTGEDAVRITCGDHETFGIFRTYADQPEMTLIALIGSSGFLELAIVGDSAAIMLGEGRGAPVKVTW